MIDYKYKKNKEDHTILIVIIAIVAVLIIFIGSNLLRTDYTVDIDKLYTNYKSAVQILKINPFDLRNNKVLADFYYIVSRREEILNRRFRNEGISYEIVKNQINRWENYNLPGLNLDFIKVSLEAAKTDEDIDLLEEYLKYSNEVIEQLRLSSLKYYKRILAINERFLDNIDYFKIGRLYYSMGQYYYHISKRFLFKSIDKRYSETEVYLLLGNIFYKEKNIAEANKWFEKAYDNQKQKSLIVVYNYAKSLYYLENYNKCLFIVNQKLKTLLNSGIFTASKQINLYSELSPENIDEVSLYDKTLISNLIILKLELLIKLDRYNEAYKKIDDYKLLFVSNEYYYNMLGNLYKVMDMPENSIIYFTKASELSNIENKYEKIIEELKGEEKSETE